MSSTVVDVIGVFGGFWEITNSSWLAMLVDSARKYTRHKAGFQIFRLLNELNNELLKKLGIH